VSAVALQQRTIKCSICGVSAPSTINAGHAVLLLSLYSFVGGCCTAVLLHCCSHIVF
jgi:hypothetical protein